MPRTTKPKAVTTSHSDPETSSPPAEPNDSKDQQVTADAELTAEEYLLHRAEVLARLPAEADRPKNIYARLAQLNGFIGIIRKSGVNSFHHYAYAKESDLVEEIRPMLAEYGIWLEQGLHADPTLGFIPHQRLGQYKSGSNVTVESLTVITKRFRFVWWNPESKILEGTEWEPFMGYGDDTGDKGYYKAETGAVKYFLMKTFMIATGNDPEADAKVDERAERRGAGGYEGQQQRPTRASGQAAQPGGRQQQTSAPQGRQIGELLRALKITKTTEAITKLEAITGDKIEIKDPEEMAEALGAYITGLPGPKAGAVVKRLREEVEASASDDPAKTKTETETTKPPAAAGFTEDEAAAVTGEAKVWSEQGGAGDEAKADDGADEGTIDNAIE